VAGRPDLAFVVRAMPRAKDPFWSALEASGLSAGAAGPDRLEALERAGIVVWELPVERVARGELDRDSAELRAADALAENVAALEARVAAQRIAIVAFVGNALFFAALGSRIDWTDEESGAPVAFGGARAVALPGMQRNISAAGYLARFRGLAALRAEARAAASEAQTKQYGEPRQHQE
jgi:hypothetical protein